MNLFDINNIAFNIGSYALSYVELIGTAFGFISVFYASKANILTWPTGIINEVFLFMLFFQVQLYADMLLRFYFLAVTIYGWKNWAANTVENKISTINLNHKIMLAAIILAGSIIAGFLFSNIHLYLPAWFKVKAAYPYTDSFIMMMSVVATVLLAKKKIENWYLWIALDVVCVLLYFKKGIYFLSLEYFIFLGLASFGLYNWKKQLRYDESICVWQIFTFSQRP